MKRKVIKLCIQQKTTLNTVIGVKKKLFMVELQMDLILPATIVRSN